MGRNDVSSLIPRRDWDEVDRAGYGLRQVLNFSGVDLSTYPLDSPIGAFPDTDLLKASLAVRRSW